MPLKDVGTTGLKMFDHKPEYPKQHTYARRSDGAYWDTTSVPDGSRQEWQSILNNQWMQNEFPGGITPAGSGYSFDCATECGMHQELWGASSGFGYGWSASHGLNGNIPWFSVNAPNGGVIKQNRWKYDNIDMCRACRQKCCQRACCDGDDDDSWTWGCDVFRQKTNPAAPTAMPSTRSDGKPDDLFNPDGTQKKAPVDNYPFDDAGLQRDAMDPYWYCLLYTSPSPRDRG